MCRCTCGDKYRCPRRPKALDPLDLESPDVGARKVPRSSAGTLSHLSIPLTKDFRLSCLCFFHGLTSVRTP